MKTRNLPLLLLLMASLTGIGDRPANAADPWVAGQHYYVLQPAEPTDLPKGKVQLTEIFSYGCPACNSFAPFMRQLAKSLPANVVVDYLPAGWIKQEDWPMFQRAYLTAKSLGIADRTHEQMYIAIWGTGELGIADPVTRGPKAVLPTIDQAAAFYQRIAGVPAAHFLQVAQSFGIESAIQSAERKIRGMGTERTPTLIINGKYRADGVSAGGNAQLAELARWLINRELGKTH